MILKIIMILEKINNNDIENSSNNDISNNRL